MQLLLYSNKIQFILNDRLPLNMLIKMQEILQSHSKKRK